MSSYLHLKHSADFKRLSSKGYQRKSRFIVIHFQKHLFPNNSPAQFGITVSKKFGKAHDRNLLKRRIRAVIIENLSKYNLQNCDIVILPRILAKTASFLQIKQDIICNIKYLRNKFL